MNLATLAFLKIVTFLQRFDPFGFGPGLAIVLRSDAQGSCFSGCTGSALVVCEQKITLRSADELTRSLPIPGLGLGARMKPVLRRLFGLIPTRSCFLSSFDRSITN